MYIIGAVCLISFPIVANMPGMMVYLKRQVIAVTFVGVFFTSFLTVLYATPRLVQIGGYIMVLVYMLVYFMTGVRPLTLLITSLIAGLLPLPILELMHVNFDAIIYFYAVIFSNVVGFLVGHTVTGKERYNFLQSRLLALDKLHAEVMSSELVRLSNEDSLTGLYNRRYFNDAIEREWERATRTHEPLSVIFVDIDYFKAYNDTYGHQQGDKALVEVSKILQSQLRRSADVAARYGGEEFILLLPNTPKVGAQVVASNISKAVDTLKIAHRASKVADYLTLSIGISTWNQEAEVDATKLIAQADMAVYQAKEQGRHAIRMFGIQ
jgi:diguanylate cyclase (GGDEF)-like protein